MLCTFSFVLTFKIALHTKIEKPLQEYVKMDLFYHKNPFVLAITRKFCRFPEDLANPGASAEFSINSFLVNLLYQNTQSLRLSKLWRLYSIFFNLYFFYHLLLILQSTSLPVSTSSPVFHLAGKNQNLQPSNHVTNS